MGNISVLSTNGTTATIGGEAFDKHTVYSSYDILSSASAGASKYWTYSLSSYLPSDSSTYDYEVLITGTGVSGTSSGNTVSIKLLSGTVTSTSDNYQGYLIGACTARTAASTVTAGSAWIPIYSSDRNVTFTTQGGSGTSTSVSLRAVCYRRLGKNDEIKASVATRISHLGSRIWQAIVYGNNKFVALGYAGHVSTSTDGVNWTSATQSGELSTENGWEGLAYGKEKYVALNSLGYTSTSTDGVNWTYPVHNTNLSNGTHWCNVTYGNGKFVALDEVGYISTSIDGTTWANATQNANLSTESGWKEIKYGNGTFVAITCGSSGIAGKYSTSTTGTTWTTPSAMTTVYDQNTLAFCNNSFLCITTDGIILTSNNGTNWKRYSQPLGDYTWQGLTYGDNKFVALSQNGYISILNFYIKQITAANSTNTIAGTKYSGSLSLFATPVQLWSGSLSTTTGTKASLNAYLYPSNYDYEVIIGGKGSTPSTKGKNVGMSLNAGSSYNSNTRTWLFRRLSRTDAAYYEGGTITLPTSKSDRNIYIYNPAAATLSNSAVYLYGYRRLPIDPTGNVVSNINGFYFGGTNFDSSIKTRLDQLLSNGSLTVNTRVYTYSLAGYLPSDGCSYMVSFSGWIRSNSGSSQLEAYILGGTKTVEQMTSNGFIFAQTDYHSTSTYIAAGTVKVYIPASDRNVTFFIHNKSTSTTTGTCSLFANSFRRVGSNV